MSVLTRDAVLTAQDLPLEKVDVPEWGGSVYVRGMSGVDRDSFEQSLMVGGEFSSVNVRAKIVVRTACDENGQRIFTDADADAVGARNAAALTRIYEAGQRLSGMGAGALEDAVKK